jgi:hypothetical protein
MTTLHQDSLFDTTDKPTPEQPNPKSMRELLFAGLVMQLEADAADLAPAFDPDEYQRDADGRARSGSAYWQAYQQARGIRLALAAVRSRLQTHEEYLLADAERRHRAWTEAERACAQHRDTCPHCTSHTQAMWQARRREDHQERIRAIYVEDLHQIIQAIADPERTVTLTEVRKRLERLRDAGHRAWSMSASQDAP